jgi:hypothetical protein
MGDALNSMDPVARTTLAIFLTIMIKTMILSWWDKFKERKALEPIPMKERNGVYVPWGIVQKVQNFGIHAARVWGVYMLILLLMLAYTKIVGPIF